MAENYRMQQRRANKSVWDTSNYVLADGEIGVERDTGVIKVGDGVTAWSGLPAAFGSTYLPVLGKAADSDRLDGIDSTGFVQIGDMSALATPSKGALRNSSGRLKAATGTEADDLTTLAQQQAAIAAGKLLGYSFKGNGAIVLGLDAIDKVIAVGNTGGINTVVPVTIPKNTTTNFPVGQILNISAVGGTGTLRLTPASGVTLVGDGRVYGGGMITIMQLALDYWQVMDRSDPPGSFARCFAFADTTVTGWAIYWQNIPFNAESIDTHNGHPTGVITGSDTDATSKQNRYTVQPGQAGTYRVSAQINITVGTTSTVHCRVLKNGNWFKGGSGIIMGTQIAGIIQTGEKLLDLNEGDWVSTQGYCNNSNWNTDAGESSAGSSTSWFNVERIA